MNFSYSLVAAILLAIASDATAQPSKSAVSADRSSFNEHDRQVKRGKYLAQIGVCAACHTPPSLKGGGQGLPDTLRIQQLRANPDWYQYLDAEKPMSGGVPFLLRISSSLTGVVYARNITPDSATGLGMWSIDEIKRVIATGVRKDGTSLFLFPPHTFYPNLAQDDLQALAVYLKSLKPIANAVPERDLAFPTSSPPTAVVTPKAPREGASGRAEYLLKGLVGCIECHSHRRADGSIAELVGGKPGTGPFMGVFRLGPDLPLTATEKGIATFPYPGFAALYAGNLTRYGKGGDLSHIPAYRIARSIRSGIGVLDDSYGRQTPVGHVMMWQFYSKMSDADVSSIASFIKRLKYEQAYTGPRLIYFGDRWDELFEHLFGERPNSNDNQLFGKN